MYRHLFSCVAATIASIYLSSCDTTVEELQSLQNIPDKDQVAANPDFLSDDTVETTVRAKINKAEAHTSSTASPIERKRMAEWLSNRYAKHDVVKTLQTTDGDEFDCVYFDRQPAFAIRNSNGKIVDYHDVDADQVKAELDQFEKKRMSESSSRIDGEYPGILDSVKCPKDTVPIQRYDLDIIARFPTLEHFQRRSAPHDASQSKSTRRATVHEYAKVDYTVDNLGGSGGLNIWNPYVSNDEFSLSQIWVVRGSGSNKQTIEAGWQDYPNRTGSSKPKLFVFSTQDGYGSTGCYDQTCDDWVQWSSSVVPGNGWTNHSVDGGSQYSFDLVWFRGSSTGNWYLSYDAVTVGYYPSNLYDTAGLGNKAARVSFGGEITDRTSSQHTSTDMGSGKFPSKGWRHAAYTRNLEYRSTSATWNEIPESSLSSYITDWRCYDLESNDTGGSWDTHFYFGGSGFNSGCP